MMFVLLLSVAFATKCTYDSKRTSDNYLEKDNYHERYCNHACPCDGAEDGCEMDFTYSEFRELQNVTGTIETLTTRDYEFTYAFPLEKQFQKLPDYTINLVKDQHSQLVHKKFLLVMKMPQ